MNAHPSGPRRSGAKDAALSIFAVCCFLYMAAVSSEGPGWRLVLLGMAIVVAVVHTVKWRRIHRVEQPQEGTSPAVSP